MSHFFGFIVPVILNRWMLPTVLHSFIGLPNIAHHEMNNIIFTALENM